MGEPLPEISVRITEVVADATGMPIEALPPLSDAIDPDALDALISPKTGAPPGVVTVTFRYAGLQLVVNSEQVIYAHPIDDGLAGPRSGAIFNR